MNDKIREEFEAWISLPPFEHMCDRNSDNSSWPGQYKRYETQLAWEAWKAAYAVLRQQLSEARKNVALAVRYAAGYLLDEADDRSLCVDDEQHEMAKALVAMLNTAPTEVNP